jgi:hypothetical protein
VIFAKQTAPLFERDGCKFNLYSTDVLLTGLLSASPALQGGDLNSYINIINPA